MASSKETVIKLLKSIGIEVNGKNDWDIQIHNEEFYNRVLGGGSLFLGESYMDGWWECKRVDLFIEKLIRNKLSNNFSFSTILLAGKSMIINMQSTSRAFEVGEQHYDTDNELFRLMLDKQMIYSCGYWKNTKSLDKAQEQKLDLICKKLNLKPGMSVLE